MMRITLRVTILATLSAFLFFHVTAYADTHWANPLGSNEAPYTTYATGAHYLQDAVAALSEGDTLKVAAGEYDLDTTIYSPSDATWIGAGKDSVTIAWTDMEQKPVRMIILRSNTEISSLGFLSPVGSDYYSSIRALYMQRGKDTNLTVHDCRFKDCTLFSNGSGDQEVYNNEFYMGSGDGIYFKGVHIRIHHNFFCGKTGGSGVVISYGNYPVIEHNVFYGGDPVGVFHATFVSVRNNLMIGSRRPVSWLYASGVVENNTMVGATGIGTGSPVRYIIPVGLRPYETLIVRNNAMIDFSVPWEFNPECLECDTTGLITFIHNAFWPPKEIHYRRNIDFPEWQVKLLDSANYEYYPMFADDSLYTLQQGSPLIDAGDPAVFDVDSSRADIGWTGGPGGYTYEYPQMSPDPPDSLWIEGNDNEATVTWSFRPEADLAGYRLCRGITSGFWYPGMEPVLEIPEGDTVAVDTVPASGGSFYYVVTAVDTAGLESGPSPEKMFVSTGIFDDPGSPHIPLTPRILGVYPNPFNMTINIEYYISNVGAQPTVVRVIIYDILGRKVATLVDQKEYPGEHQASWDGRDESGNPVPSGVYFARLTLWGYEFKSSVKLVLQK